MLAGLGLPAQWALVRRWVHGVFGWPGLGGSVVARGLVLMLAGPSGLCFQYISQGRFCGT